MSATAAPLWDAEALARARHLHLRARHLTDALLLGAHRSRRVGQAVEFADFQPYQPGMDLRGLDWRVWGRTDRHVIRRFETETELPCTLVVDLSGDLGTGARRPDQRPDLASSKAGRALVLAATLAWWMHRQGEPVGLELVAGVGAPWASLPPRGGRNHALLILQCLAAVRPGGQAGLAEALGRVGARTRRRSWVGVITDGMEEPAGWLPALGAFAKRGADLRFFHLYDRDEWGLTRSTPAVFFSPEDGAVVPVDPVAARGAFAAVARDYVAEVRSGVVRWGGRYHLVAADDPLDALVRRAILDVPDPAGTAPWETRP